jgi:hypothetical protein
MYSIYRTTLLILVVLLLPLGADSTRLDLMLDIPGRVIENYKVDTYIQDAVRLQGQGKAEAYASLATMASKKGQRHKIYTLCRMLFTNRKGVEFRRPRIGGAAFLGRTDYSDWPLEPIEIVDGVPFLITKGYMLGGKPEYPEMYLNYCLKNCEWGGTKFTIKTEEEKQMALKRLLESTKWKAPLNKYEKQFLSDQIK